MQAEAIVLGCTDKHHSGMVYSVGGVSMCITAGTHGYGMGYVLEVKKIESV